MAEVFITATVVTLGTEEKKPQAAEGIVAEIWLRVVAATFASCFTHEDVLVQERPCLKPMTLARAFYWSLGKRTHYLLVLSICVGFQVRRCVCAGLMVF